MHTMFSKHHRASTASSRAETDAAMQIAQTMANNCTNTLDTNIIQNNNLTSLAASLASNPISQCYDIVGKPGSTAGPELAWRIIDATRRSDKKEASIWFFDRKWVEKFGKSAKRIDCIMERLKRGAIQLERHKHVKIISVYNQLIEANDTLAFATEPILGSLANITGYLEDRLRQGVPSSLREFTFNDFEIKYGLLQIAEALVFLHHTCKSIHGNICPQSIIINKYGTWKLSVFEFLEKCNEDDPMLPVNAMVFTSKFPKMSQIDLDFSAPEIQCSNAMSQQSDMFSMGLLICSIFNNGRSPIQANLNTTTYLKQLETINQKNTLMNQFKSMETHKRLYSNWSANHVEIIISKLLPASSEVAQEVHVIDKIQSLSSKLTFF